MAESPGAAEIDTVIVGNGPSALLLSYILSGHIPYYAGGHDDRKLNARLTASPDLLHVAPEVYSHLENAVNYTSQALPINTLLDTLVRPNGDIDLGSKTCVEWRHESDRAVRHLVIGNAPSAGGQWASNPVKASWDIGTLSYAEQLSLPGYSIADHWQKSKHEALPDLMRPTRSDIADYLKAYPAAVGIEGNIRTSAQISEIARTASGFSIQPFNIRCRHLIIASGVSSVRLPPPAFLRPLVALSDTDPDGAVLVIGSGFTAADIIISTPPERKIVHLFNWDPTNRPSPLKSCHSSAYPEYAWIYRQMKLATLRNPHNRSSNGILKQRRAPASAIQFFSQRDWTATYSGFANAHVLSHSMNGKPTRPRLNGHVKSNGLALKPGHEIQTGATITISTDTSSSDPSATTTHRIGSFSYATGRRGSLSYLNNSLLSEVLPFDPFSPPVSPNREVPDVFSGGEAFASLSLHNSEDPSVPPLLMSGNTLRAKIVAQSERPGVSAAGLEMARDVFVIGSLTGDSLIRFAVGGCCAVAGAVMERSQRSAAAEESREECSY